MEGGEKAGRGETRRQAPRELLLPEGPGGRDRDCDSVGIFERSEGELSKERCEWAAAGEEGACSGGPEEGGAWGW